MEIAISSGRSSKPKIYKLSREKYKVVIELLDFIADDIVNENSKEYKLFLGEEIKKALKTRRVKSGNSLRDII